MTNTRKWFFSAVGLVLIAAVVAGIFQYRIERQHQAEEALALIEVGIAQFKNNQYETAVETFRSIPEGAIKDWRPPYYVGTALIQLRDYEAAVVSLEDALSLNNMEEGIPFALGVAYFKLGKLGLSKSYFHTVLEINPNNADAKGLMDIMANLERQQLAEPAPKSELNTTELPESSPQQSDN